MDHSFTWLYLIIAIAVFIICREIVCWYWKLTDVVALLKDIKQSLNEIKSELNSRPSNQQQKSHEGVQQIEIEQ